MFDKELNKDFYIKIDNDERKIYAKTLDNNWIFKENIAKYKKRR
jgi:hypothetical protein